MKTKLLNTNLCFFFLLTKKSTLPYYMNVFKYTLILIKPLKSRRSVKKEQKDKL